MKSVKEIVSNHKRIFFIFSENDRLYSEFKEKIYDPNLKYFKDSSEFIKVHVEKNANHTFTLIEWQKNIINQSCTWLLENFKKNIQYKNL